MARSTNNNTTKSSLESTGPSSALPGAGALSRENSLVTGNIPGCQLSPGKKREYVSLREFARREGVSLTAVQKAISGGRLITLDIGKRWPVLDYAEAKKAWDGSRIPQNNNRFGELDGDDVEEDDGLQWGVRYTKERALLTEEQRKLAHIEREEIEGKLHRDEDVEAVWSNILIAFRTKILAIPSKIAPRIASITAFKDIPKLQGILEESCREVLTELSRYDPAQIKQARKRRTGK